MYKKRASRGGLTVPSLSLISNTILDFVDTELTKKKNNSPKRNFTCEEHFDWEHKFAIKFYSKYCTKNKQKELNDTVRKDIVKHL